MNNAQMIELLLVDDDIEFRRMMARWFRQAGFAVTEAANGEEAFSLASRKEFDVAVLDLMMPGADGVSVLKEFKASGAEAEVILLTGKATVTSAVEAMKSGAFDYLMKPVPLRELEAVVRRAHERGDLSRENRRLKVLLNRSEPQREMVGQSPEMQRTLRLIERAGSSDAPVLIQGESGSGKELAARMLHKASPRGDKPFVVVSSATIPAPNLEAELFGSEGGAASNGASPGLLETADSGSVFVEEVADLPPELQSKLMHLLGEGAIRRVGAVREHPVDVRVIAGTTRNLAEEVRAGRFREDLYYRINTMSLELPPLRSRPGDIPLLVASMLGPGWSIEPDALGVLQAFSWPGNVRQLGNVIERAKILADGESIQIEDLPEEVRQAPAPGAAGTRDSDNLASIERAKVVEVLRRMSGNKTHAARKLGIDRRKLYRLVEKYDIHKDEFQEAGK